MAQRSRVIIVAAAVVLAAAAAAAAQQPETISARSQTSRTGEEEEVIESYWPSVDGGRLAIWQRVRRVTTATPDGTETVEETEARPRGSAIEPMRMIQRSVTTVRKTGPGSYVTERRVFERDVNDRFVLVSTETEHTSRK